MEALYSSSFIAMLYNSDKAKQWLNKKPAPAWASSPAYFKTD
jgi:hypothetical protein